MRECTDLVRLSVLEANSGTRVKKTSCFEYPSIIRLAMLLIIQILNSLPNPLPSLPLDISLYLRPASGIWRRPTSVNHAFKLRTNCYRWSLAYRPIVGHHVLVAIETGDVATGANSGEENTEEQGEVAAAGCADGADIADRSVGLHAGEGASVFAAEEECSAPDVGAEEGASE